MKKILTLYLGLLLSISVFAAQTVKLYQSPSASSTVLTSISLKTPLTAIYHQGDWLKVGNTTNGRVGWINLKEYQAAVKAARHSQVSSVIVSVQQMNKQPKQITVYKNGQKLEGKAAKKAYEEAQKSQVLMERNFQHAEAQIDHMMRQQDQEFQRMMHSMMVSMPDVTVVESSHDLPAPKNASEADALKAHQQFQQTRCGLLSGRCAIKQLQEKSGS